MANCHQEIFIRSAITKYKIEKFNCYLKICVHYFIAKNYETKNTEKGTLEMFYTKAKAENLYFLQGYHLVYIWVSLEYVNPIEEIKSGHFLIARVISRCILSQVPLYTSQY